MKSGYCMMIGSLIVFTALSGCLGGGDDGDGSEVSSTPDITRNYSAGANSMSSSKIEFIDHEDSDHARIVSLLDTSRSYEKHVVYLYLFDGAPPSTSSVDLDEMNEALEDGSLESFEMTWGANEVTWEVDFDQDSTDHFTYLIWNPDRDDYDDSTPDAYVDVEIYFSKEGNLDDGGNGEKAGFREYDVTDFSEYNSDASPITVLEMCNLLKNNMEDISPGGMITAFTSGGFTGTGIDNETGKCPGWQVYVQRIDDGQTYSMVINIAENGWCIVMDDHKVMGYPVWDPDNATVDSCDLITTVNTNTTVQSFLMEHPNAKLTLQSYHGPPLGSDEESYLLMYESGEDALNIYISAKDGRLIEVEDPNDWSFDW